MPRESTTPTIKTTRESGFFKWFGRVEMRTKGSSRRRKGPIERKRIWEYTIQPLPPEIKNTPYGAFFIYVAVVYGFEPCNRRIASSTTSRFRKRKRIGIVTVYPQGYARGNPPRQFLIFIYKTL